MEKNGDFIQESANGGSRLKVYIQPRASANKVCGRHGDAIKIRITAPPVDGKANGMVIKFIAKLLKIPKSAVAVTAGQQSRSKTLTLQDIPPSKVESLLKPYL